MTLKPPETIESSPIDPVRHQVFGKSELGFFSSIKISMLNKALAIVLRTIAIAIAIEVKKSIEYCNMQ